MVQVISVLFKKGRDDDGKAWGDLEVELELAFSGQVWTDRLRKALGIKGGDNEIIELKWTGISMVT